jgi:hypothetical protein
MAKWLDRLEDAGRKAVEQAKPPRPAPEIHRIIVSTRPSDPESGDPGSAKIAYWTLEGDLVTLVDENGTPLRSEGDRLITAIVEPGADARAVASSLVYRRARGDRGNFNRRLDYPRTGWM